MKNPLIKSLKSKIYYMAKIAKIIFTISIPRLKGLASNTISANPSLSGDVGGACSTKALFRNFTLKNQRKSKLKFKTVDPDHQVKFEFLFFLGLNHRNPKEAHRIILKLIVSGTIEGNEDVLSLTI